jgi:hypothetical protein
MRREGGDVVERFSDELARQALSELLLIQCESARMRLNRERKDASRTARLILTSFASGIVITLWISVLL